MPYMQCSPKQNPGQLAGILDDVESAVSNIIKNLPQTSISVGGGQAPRVTHAPPAPVIPVTPGVIAGMSVGTLALLGLGIFFGAKLLKGGR